MDTFFKINEHLLDFITHLPLQLKKEISSIISRNIQHLELDEESAVFFTLLKRLDAALTIMDNTTAADIPTNLSKLLHWYKSLGMKTLDMWLKALQTEYLHRFLVDNPLPNILSSPKDFFCGAASSSRLSSYFNDTKLESIKTSLCDVGWDNISSEFEGYFLKNSAEYQFDFFNALDIVNRITNQFIVPEWSKLSHVVVPYYQTFKDYTFEDL